ncbi:hypothetical protein V1527DRAFT_516583 [Lipomyces starkeyi]
MQLAKTIGILQCSGRGTKATNLVECMIGDGRKYYDSSASLRRGIQKNAAAFQSIYRSGTAKRNLQGTKTIAVTWRKHSYGQRREKFSAISALLEAANKRRHEEELDSTEPNYKRHLLEKHRCCVKSCTNNGNTCFVRGQRHFPISAKHLNDWNESIKIAHATVHSLPSSIDPLPAKGTSNPNYADHPLTHPSSPAPYPQLPPQYWHQSALYPPSPANYYYPFIPPNYSPTPVPARDAALTSISAATPATANITISQTTSTESDPADIFDDYIEWYAAK